MFCKNKENKLLYVSFNQDASYFIIGTQNGFSIYNTLTLQLVRQRSTPYFLYIHASGRLWLAFFWNLLFNGSFCCKFPAIAIHLLNVYYQRLLTCYHHDADIFVNIRIAELLHQTNIVLLSGDDRSGEWANSKLRVWDDSLDDGTVVAELEFRSEVQSVKVKRDRYIPVSSFNCDQNSNPFNDQACCCNRHKSICFQLD